MDEICARCRKPLTESQNLVVELRVAGVLRHRSIMTGLHPACGERWARIEMRWLKRRFRKHCDVVISQDIEREV